MITTYLKKQLLDAIAGVNKNSGSSSIPNGQYMGLSTTTPTVGTYNGGTASDCNFTEPSDSAYSRVYIGGSSSILLRYPFVYPTGTTTYDSVSNQLEVHFDASTQSWGTITYVGIFDGNSASSHLIAYAQLNTPVSIPADSIATILEGNATISIEVQE